LNTGVRGLDESGRTFVASDRFQALSDHGFRDAWRERHGPTARQSSWWSNQHNGFRLDHCFVTDTVAVNSAEYERHSGSHLLAVDPDIHEDGAALSDHAALVVDVDVRSAAGGFSAQR
jgi:exonuclease III